MLGIWDKPEKSDALEVLKAIGKLLPPPQPGTQSSFALSEDGRIENSCKNAGVKVIYKAVVPCPFVFANISDALRGFMGTGSAAEALNDHDKGVVEDTILNAISPYGLADGIYFMENSFLVFIAEK